MATVKLKWPHKVDTSQGMEPSAYGIKLFLDEDGTYFAEVSEERAAVEKTREGKCFVDPSDSDPVEPLSWEGDNE